MKKIISFDKSDDIVHQVYNAKVSSDCRNEIIKKYIPFIIKSISEVTKTYVKIGDSDELSIGLMAFNEAIDRYESEKGLFLSYAKLVIKSRVKNYIEKVQSGISTLALEEIDQARNFSLENEFDSYSDSDLQEEILVWKKELLKFNITFDDLLRKKPKHRDTRKRAFEIARNVSSNKIILSKMFEKYRLPISLIKKELNISVKILEGGRVFIISIVIIFTKKLGAIRRWIQWD